MIQGNLRDVSFPDLLQFLHLSGRSGTLYLERDAETAFVSFHHGRIASAWCPTSAAVVDYLQQAGQVSAADVARARAMHDGEQAARTLGQILIAIAAVTREGLRQAVARKIEQTVFELLAWSRGAFRFVVEEVRYDPELLFAPNEVLVQVDLDAQVVLMEALRLSGAPSRESRPSLAAEAARAVRRLAPRDTQPELPPAMPEVMIDAGSPPPDLALVKALLRDIRAGAATPRLALSLMAVLAQSADRGILFMLRRNSMVALTAFGRTRDRHLLTQATDGLSIPFEDGGPFAQYLDAEDAQEIDWDRRQLPETLAAMLGLPATGAGVLVPVRGAKRLIAVIYADNGDKPEPVRDLELIEIASGQFGLAIENEILRRHIERTR